MLTRFRRWLDRLFGGPNLLPEDPSRSISVESLAGVAEAFSDSNPPDQGNPGTAEQSSRQTSPSNASEPDQLFDPAQISSVPSEAEESEEERARQSEEADLKWRAKHEAKMERLRIEIRRQLAIKAKAEAKAEEARLRSEQERKDREQAKRKQIQDRYRAKAAEQRERERQYREEQRKLERQRRKEQLDAGWQKCRTGCDFEYWLYSVFRKYRCRVEHQGKSGDMGVDLVVTLPNKKRFAIQAKHWTGSVGNGAVQEVFAGMKHFECHGCAVITSSWFTDAARKLAATTGCRLVDQEMLPALSRGDFSMLGCRRKRPRRRKTEPSPAEPSLPCTQGEPSAVELPASNGVEPPVNP